MKKNPQNFVAGFFISISVFFFQHVSIGSDTAPERPHFYLNGKQETPTVQDLSGIGTQPLQSLVQRNNQFHKDEVIQVYAVGTHEGDDLQIKFDALMPGMRVTLYRLIKNTDGKRFFTLPFSIYHGEKSELSYHEKIGPYRSEYLIIAFEKTGFLNKKSENLLYFERRKRDLLVKSIRPNFKFSSLNIKMKDRASNEEAFAFDAQELIDRFINPQRIFVIRLWKDERCCSETKRSS